MLGYITPTATTGQLLDSRFASINCNLNHRELHAYTDQLVHLTTMVNSMLSRSRALQWSRVVQDSARLHNLHLLCTAQVCLRNTQPLMSTRRIQQGRHALLRL